MVGTSVEKAGKGDRTRARLLEIAIARFATTGFRGTSVSVIAREAHLTPAAVYAYFDGKEALFVAAVDADAGALIDRARRASSRNTVFDRLVTLVEALTAHLDAHPLARRVLAGLEPDVVGRLLALPTLAVMRDAFAADVQGAQARGEIRSDLNAADLAVGIETMVLTLLMGIVQTGVDDRARDIGMLTVWRGLLTVPRDG